MRISRENKTLKVRNTVTRHAEAGHGSTVLTVHDSVIACVPESEAEEAQQYVEKCMRYVPTWAKGLPLECESGMAKAYGDCE